MKNIVFVLITVLSISICKADDFDKYRVAYEYITSDTINLNNWFKQEMKYDTLPTINVSKEVVYLSYFGFTDSVIVYEKIKPGNKLHILFIDSLTKLLDSLNEFKTYYYDKLLTLNKSDQPKFILYFSRMEKGVKLKAEVIPYEQGMDEYSDTWHYSYRIVRYLFYFKNNKIKKVIRTEGWVN